MSVVTLTPGNPTFLIVPRRGSITNPPQSVDDGVNVGVFPRVRALVRYSGTVTRCVLRVWLYDHLFAAWYSGASTDDLDPLAPTTTPIDAPEGREWLVGVGQQVMMQLEAIEGGGEVEVYLSGAREVRQ